MMRELDNPYTLTAIVLGGLYLPIILIPLVQFIRIVSRTGFQWSTQKLFLFFSAVGNTLRVAFFIYVLFGKYEGDDLFLLDVHKYPVFSMLCLIPGLIFWTTYGLLVLFWCEIIQKARGDPFSYTKRLKPTFVIINFVVYFIQALLWAMLYFIQEDTDAIETFSDAFFALLCLVLSFGFFSSGTKLFRMLKDIVPSGRRLSEGRSSKLVEVGTVMAICSVSLFARGAVIVFFIFRKAVVLSYVFVAVYYVLIEIIPSMLVIFIFRRLPPKRGNDRAALIESGPGRGLGTGSLFARNSTAK
eukprot:GCRY01001194.1.p1 GENE.GCRY01001194.1~~GCRY01001194.1.p1  ORF type:complete len:300 (-),score=46.83 GCRY01001194.1:140-1039(-)